MIRNKLVCIIYYLCIFILLFLVSGYIAQQNNLSLLSNNFYTENAKVIPIDSLNQIITSSETNLKECRIFIEKNENIRYFKQIKGKWIPPMIEGRFFNHGETGKKVVIGKSYADKIIVVNQIKYIELFGEKYEVIGIIGASFKSDIDTLILISIEDFNKFEQREFVLDSNIKFNLEELGLSYFINDNSLVTSKSRGIVKIEGIFPFKSLMKIGSLLLSIVGITIYIKYWHQANKKQRYILYLVGNSIEKIFIINIIELFINTFISAFILMVLANSFFEIDNIGFSLYYTYLVTMLYSCCVLGFLYVQQNGKEIV